MSRLGPERVASVKEESVLPGVQIQPRDPACLWTIMSDTGLKESFVNISTSRGADPERTGLFQTSPYDMAK